MTALLSSPIQGKTYSLYGLDNSTEPYYQKIERLTNSLLETTSDPIALLERLTNLSSSKRSLKHILRGRNSPDQEFLAFLENELSPYVLDVDKHRSTLTCNQKFDRTLNTSFEQYLLYMLEIELVNRINKLKFLRCQNKIALLPHCLRDLSRKCESSLDGLDYVCKKCSDSCFVRYASEFLRQENIEAYIWLDTDFKKIFKHKKKHRASFGVLGIACIPMLIWGMRLCLNLDLAVVGLPLDANRCIRWLGAFYPNSVNLQELEKLLRV